MTLDSSERHRRRVVLTAERGLAFLLDLPHATVLRDGDGLVLDDGAIIRVAGKPEPLVEISAASPSDLVRISWHIGNRHADVQIVGDKLRIQRDHVLEEMLHGLGARLAHIDAPFDPESGAYEQGTIITMATGTIMARKRISPRNARVLPRAMGVDHAALYRLMTWLSPAYPIGAFSYSSGIEWAIEAGDITDAKTLKRWLTVMLKAGGGFCDAVFLVHAHRAIAQKDDALLREVAELAAAFAPSKERFLETTAQGQAFLATAREAWPCAALDRLLKIWDGPIALADRGWRGLRRARRAGRARHARLSSGTHGKSHLGGRAPHPARSDRRPAPDRGA